MPPAEARVPAPGGSISTPLISLPATGDAWKVIVSPSAALTVMEGVVPFSVVPLQVTVP